MAEREPDLIPYAAASLPAARSVLVLAPHPDDEVFGCGGTLAMLARLGTSVQVIVATDSDWGAGFADGANRVAVRRAESEAAARILGYDAPDFWGLADRSLVFSEPLVALVVEALYERATDLLLAPAPREIHPDHHALGLAALEAARRVGGSLRVWLYEISAPIAPNRLIDISAVVDLKHAAMRAFPTQLAMRPYDRCVAALDCYRAYTLEQVDAAEAFHELNAGELVGGVRAMVDRIATPLARQAQAVPPLVSVIVRSVNRPSLREALDSIAGQSYRWTEIVVVDVKGTLSDLPQLWQALPLRVVAPLSSTRPAAANAGLVAARGEWLLFLDDDDLLLAPHLDRLVSVARERGPLCAPYAGIQVVDASGAQVDVYDYPDAAERLPAHNPFPIHSVLFARQWVDAGLRFDESLPVLEDWDFWLQLARRAQFVHVPGVSAIYRAALGDSGVSLADDAAAREAGRRTVLQRWSGRLQAQQFDAALARERSAGEQARAESARERHRADDLQSHLKQLQRLLDNERSAHRATVATAQSIAAERDAAITQAQKLLAERDAAITQAQKLLAERDALLAQTLNLGAERDVALSSLHEMRHSRSWRITAPLRAATDALRSLRARVRGRMALAATAAPPAPVATPSHPPAPSAATPVAPVQRRTVAVLVTGAADAETIARALAGLPADARLCLPARPEGAFGFDARVQVLGLPAESGFGEQIAALRAQVPGAHVIVVADGAPVPDQTTIATLLAPLERSIAIASVSAAATGADVFGVTLPAEVAAGLAACRDLRWPQDFDALTENWPGPRGGAVALRFEALRDLGAPRDRQLGLARWAELSRAYGWAHAAAPLRIVSPHDVGPTAALLLEPAASARWAAYVAAPALGDKVRGLVFEQLLFSRGPPVLLLDHNLGGGANRYRARRIARWLADDRPVLLYHDDLHNDTAVMVLHHPLAGEWQRGGVEMAALLQLAARGPWSEVFFNNAAHARDPLGMPALLLRLKELTRAPLAFALHDFYSLCPTYVLLTGEAKHCGVPQNIAVCERCLPGNRFDPHQNRVAMRDWRAAWQPAVEAADAVIAFSESSAALLARAYPAAAARTRVEPHAVPAWPQGTAVPLDWSSGLRIGIVGSLSEAKGSAIVVELAQEIARRGLQVPLVLIGQLTDRPLPQGVTCTGAYQSTQLPRLLATHGVNCCLLPSICPETFSYVLSELMQLDLPICAFDLGAQGERLRGYAQGIVVSEVSAAAALDAMLALAARQAERAA